jgi:CheY-like chemotaxis protein
MVERGGIARAGTLERLQLTSKAGRQAAIDLANPRLFLSKLIPVSERSVRSESETQAAMLRRARCILLVEDHLDGAAVITLWLTHSGYDVTVAHTVQAALRVDLGSVDMIVSDIGLPDGSGVDLIRRLRTERWCPAIALTGLGTQSDIAECERAGFDLHMTKPVRVEELLGAMGKLFARNGLRTGQGANH